MNQRRVLQIGTGAVALAIFFRLAAAGTIQPLALIQNRELISFFIFLETGRFPRTFVADHQTVEPTVPEDETMETTESAGSGEPETNLTLTAEDLSYVSVQYACDYRPDLGALMEASLDWDLTEDGPTVLILHSHATESYAGAENYRSTVESENMVAIGDEVARILEAGGIHAIHDRTLYDHPNYNQSYVLARSAIRDWLKAYPSIQMVLDIHRDAAETTSGQLVTSSTVGGQRSAQLMMVVGTDATGNYFPDWEENLSLALKLSAVLEQENPGICRPVTLREHRFNMDLSPGSMLVEVGAAGDTMEEARIAANALAQGILAISKGVN